MQCNNNINKNIIIIIIIIIIITTVITLSVKINLLEQHKKCKMTVFWEREAIIKKKISGPVR